MERPNILWLENVRAAFVRVYGEKRGEAVCRVVLPAVLGDFRKTVLKAAEGEPVTETYRTDDKKTELSLTGRRREQSLVLERVAVGGALIPLGAPEIVM